MKGQPGDMGPVVGHTGRADFGHFVGNAQIARFHRPMPGRAACCLAEHPVVSHLGNTPQPRANPLIPRQGLLGDMAPVVGHGGPVLTI